MTRLLHDSFKDDGKILIIAICDPTYECIEENISKINFVMNCKKASYEAMARNKYTLIINFKNQFEILSKRMDGIKTENMDFKELLENQSFELSVQVNESKVMHEKLDKLNKTFDNMKETLNAFQSYIKTSHTGAEHTKKNIVENSSEKSVNSENVRNIIGERDEQTL